MQSCLLLQDDTRGGAKGVDAAWKSNPVFNPRDKPVGGLRERNGIRYAQVKVRGWTAPVRLHNAQTVAEAQAARQVLKTEIKSGAVPLDQTFSCYT